MWRVQIKRKLLRDVESLPLNVQLRFAALKIDLELTGPVQTSWQNYSKLGENKHHCHLTHHYVACWLVVSETEMVLEVYYVGSRENAPY